MSGWLKNAVATAAIATSIATTVAAFAANDMFLKIAGIKGESADHKHKGEIEVLAWSWGIATPLTPQSGSGSGAGKTVVHDISFSKRVDSATPILFLHAANGGFIKEVTLVVRKTGKDQLEYIKIKLTGVRVASVKNHAVPAADAVMEEVTLAFEKVEYEYRSQSADGTAGPAVQFGWDVKANQKF